MNNWPRIVQQQRLRSGVWMNAIILHQFIVQCDAFEKELDPGNIQFCSELTKYVFKRLYIPLAVVWWNCNAKHYDSSARIYAASDNSPQVLAHRARWDAAEPVIAAEFQNDQLRSESLYRLADTGRATFGRIAANTGVHHAMFVPLFFQPFLQQSGPGLVNVYTVAGAEAVTEYEHSRLFVGKGLRAGEQQQQDKNTTHG